MTDQAKNAANDGDVMKHAPLGKIVEYLSRNEPEFWYVETHSAHPYYFMPQKKGKLDHLNGETLPLPLDDYLAVAYHAKNKEVHKRFPDKQTYLGSTAQVYHRLKEKGKRVLMTLFEMESAPAESLSTYFSDQGANVVQVKPRGDSRFLGDWWDVAVDKDKSKDFVMVVQGNSYHLAPSLWTNRDALRKPDLVFVDPFELNKPSGEPEKVLDSMKHENVRFMCWTPLNGKTAKWSGGWTFLTGGVTDVINFLTFCHAREFCCGWFSWRNSTSQGMYGCQLTLGNVFDEHFNPGSVWRFPDQPELPYLDVGNQLVGQSSTPPNLTNPNMTWQNPGGKLDVAAITLNPNKGEPPGAKWFKKYHAAFWWYPWPARE